MLARNCARRAEPRGTAVRCGPMQMLTEIEVCMTRQPIVPAARRGHGGTVTQYDCWYDTAGRYKNRRFPHTAGKDSPAHEIPGSMHASNCVFS